MKRYVLAALAAMLLAAPAVGRVVEKRQYGNWTYEYNVSNNVTSCIASRYYSNAQFSVRLYGETMDVVFWRDDFRWRANETFGQTRIRVAGRTYRLRTGTSDPDPDSRRTTGTLFLTVREADYRSFFADVKRAQNLKIDLWNDASYPVDLTGSSRALDAALRCWDRRRTDG